MYTSLEDHTGLVGVVSQTAVTVVVGVLRAITVIFLVVDYYNFEEYHPIINVFHL